MGDDYIEYFMDIVLTRSMEKTSSYEAAANELKRGPFDHDMLDRAVEALYALAGKTQQSSDIPTFDDGERTAWRVPDRGKDHFWPRLQDLLTDKGWPEATVKSVDDASEQVLTRVSPPWSPAFADRGLVLGYVQSGKTANFTAVMAKAADRGFQLFIVLAGIHNTLRSQTQERLEEELARAGEWHTLTTIEDDFETPASNAASYFSDRASQPVLCVIKKNKHRLEALRKWLVAGVAAHPGSLASTPTLVIDDEADQAGINTGTENDPSVINALVVDILKLLPRHGYLAYTATPYANVLTDPTQTDNLYPRDFIVSLPRPSAYFGVEKIFGSIPMTEEEEDDSLSMLRTVPIDEAQRMQPARNAIDSFKPVIVPSLEAALEWFVLASAVRMSRGHEGKHMTMLVHTTLYAEAHLRTGPLLASWVTDLKTLVQAGSAGRKVALRERWEEETARLPIGTLAEQITTFEEAWEELPRVLEQIKVVVDNGRSLERLHYSKKDGSIQIVVGGNTLSRGLTLEGLTVSYFVRASSTYDTLMQMGRWFGYRGGYADLPRIWMTADLATSFAHLATVEREIREDIDRYEALGMTPLQLGVRIKTHSTLAVTSPLKMRAVAKASATFSGQMKQTTAFHVDDEAWLQGNTDAVRTLLQAAGGLDTSTLVWSKHRLWRDIPGHAVLQFLKSYRIHENHRDLIAEAVTQPGEEPQTLLQKYIANQMAHGQLKSWNIAIVGQTRARSFWEDLLPGASIPLLIRARLEGRTHADVNTLMTQEDRAIDFGEPVSPVKRQGFVKWTKAMRDGAVDGPAANTPLLLLYPLEARSEPRSSKSGTRRPLAAKANVVGIALLFPSSSHGAVDYITVPLEEPMEPPTHEPEL